MPFIHPDRRLNSGAALHAYKDELPELYSEGVRSVVSLLNIPSDAPVFESAGFAFLCLPMPDGRGPSMKQATQFVRFVHEHRTAQRPVAVHCQEGLGRTGTMLAVYLIEQGESAEAAIRRVREVEKAAIQTSHQIQFLEKFAQRFRHPSVHNSAANDLAFRNEIQRRVDAIDSGKVQGTEAQAGLKKM